MIPEFIPQISSYNGNNDLLTTDKKKRERVEKVIADLLQSRKEDSSSASDLEGSLQNRVNDHSKKAKSDANDTSKEEIVEQDTSSCDSESMDLSSTSLTEWISSPERYKFDLYGKSDRGGFFFVYGTSEHNEAKVAEFEQQMRQKKEADEAYHEGLECLDSWIEDFERAFERLEFAAQRGHPGALFKMSEFYRLGFETIAPDQLKAREYLQRAKEITKV